MGKRAASANARGLGCTCMRLRKASRRVTQYGVLGQLRRYDGIGIGALAEILIMDPTTLTRSLRPLDRQGLVTMKPDRRDRRSRCLHLTPKGSAAFENAIPAWRRAQRRLEKALGGAEAAALNAALDHVIERLAE